jgi:hypothetical protein
MCGANGMVSAWWVKSANYVIPPSYGWAMSALRMSDPLSLCALCPLFSIQCPLTKVCLKPSEHTLVVVASSELALVEMPVDLLLQLFQGPAVDGQVVAVVLDKIHERCKMVNRTRAINEKQMVSSEQVKKTGKTKSERARFCVP